MGIENTVRSSRSIVCPTAPVFHGALPLPMLAVAAATTQWQQAYALERDVMPAAP